MYGTAEANLAISGNVSLTLDGNKTEISKNQTNIISVSLIYHADNIEDGDHQLSGSLVGGSKLLSDLFLEINYFECVIPLLHSVPGTAC